MIYRKSGNRISYFHNIDFKIYFDVYLFSNSNHFSSPILQTKVLDDAVKVIDGFYDWGTGAVK